MQGQLGNGTTASTSSPNIVPTLQGYKRKETKNKNKQKSKETNNEKQKSKENKQQNKETRNK